jgi:hypothetical protein
MKSEVIVTENQIPSDVLEAIREGRKIEAIKLLRERTGLGLANAKVLVDRATREHGPAKPIPSFDDQPAGPGAPTILLFVLLLVAAGLYFFGGG